MGLGREKAGRKDMMGFGGDIDWELSTELYRSSDKRLRAAEKRRRTLPKVEAAGQKDARRTKEKGKC